MDVSVAERPVPFEAIQTLLATARLDRKSFIINRALVKSWHESVVGQYYPISVSEEAYKHMEFVDYQLSNEEMEKAQDWLDPDDAKLSTMVNEALQDGYRVTFTQDAKNNCVVVTVIGKAAGNANHNRGMTTRHATVRAALHLAMFKHYEIFKGGSWGESQAENMFG